MVGDYIKSIKLTIDTALMVYEGAFIIIASVIIFLYRRKLKKYERAAVEFILEHQVDYGYQLHGLRYHIDVFKGLVNWKDE